MGHCPKHKRSWRDDDVRDEEFACPDCEREGTYPPTDDHPVNCDCERCDEDAGYNDDEWCEEDE